MKYTELEKPNTYRNNKKWRVAPLMKSLGEVSVGRVEVRRIEEYWERILVDDLLRMRRKAEAKAIWFGISISEEREEKP